MTIFVFLVVVIIIITYKYTQTPIQVAKQPIKVKSRPPIIRIRIFDDILSPKILRSRPDCLFLFGDNEDQAGTGGQAVIRHEPNAIGIVTKRRPFMNEDAFYDDNDFETNISAIDQSFDTLRKRVEQSSGEYKFIFIPKDGLGTGLSELPQRAPKTFIYILGLIYDLVKEYDPSSLDSNVGVWISEQETICKTIKQKRISI